MPFWKKSKEAKEGKKKKEVKKKRDDGGDGSGDPSTAASSSDSSSSSTSSSSSSTGPVSASTFVSTYPSALYAASGLSPAAPTSASASASASAPSAAGGSGFAGFGASALFPPALVASPFASPGATGSSALPMLRIGGTTASNLPARSVRGGGGGDRKRGASLGPRRGRDLVGVAVSSTSVSSSVPTSTTPPGGLDTSSALSSGLASSTDASSAGAGATAGSVTTTTTSSSVLVAVSSPVKPPPFKVNDAEEDALSILRDRYGAVDNPVDMIRALLHGRLKLRLAKARLGLKVDDPDYSAIRLWRQSQREAGLPIGGDDISDLNDTQVIMVSVDESRDAKKKSPAKAKAKAVGTSASAPPAAGAPDGETKYAAPAKFTVGAPGAPAAAGASAAPKGLKGKKDITVSDVQTCLTVILNYGPGLLDLFDHAKDDGFIGKVSGSCFSCC